MGYVGQTLRIPFDQTGFQYGRDTEFLRPFALVEPTCNVNFHEGGIGKRGGTAHYLDNALTGTPEIRGLFQFRLQNGNSSIVFADANGKLYKDNESNVLKTGMGTSNIFSFSVFDDTLFICDGTTVPQTWDGISSSTSSITGIATDWSGASDYPFQIIPHSQGANARMWAIRRDAVFASKNGDGKDFSDAEVVKIPVYSDGGLVGGFEFGGTLFVFSKTKTYTIDDTNSDPAYWGYKEAFWEGGAAHWRLATKAGNNYYLCSDDMTIYSLEGVQGTGDYRQVNLTRPAFIDRWFRDNVIRTGIEKFHSIYDRELRCINYFVQVGGTNPNTCMRFFIDREPETAWVIQNNTTAASGFNAAVSAEIKEATGVYKIYTGDFNGKIWKHEQANKNDNGNSYVSRVKVKPINMGNPRTYKHFKRGLIRASAIGKFAITLRIYVDGVRKNDISLSISGTGARFGKAQFGKSTFAANRIVPIKFDLNYYGYDLQLEIENIVKDEDFFLSEGLIDWKELNTR